MSKTEATSDITVGQADPVAVEEARAKKEARAAELKGLRGRGEPESATLSSADVGELPASTADAGSAKPDAEEKPENVLEYVQRITTNVVNVREWARVKLATIQKRIEDSGGEPTPALAEAIATLQRLIK